MLKFGFYL